MFPTWVKRSITRSRQVSESRALIGRGSFRPFLERLETRVTPAFVTGVSIADVSLADSGAYAMVTGDFDRDGKLDIVATKRDHQFQLYKGHGDGTFQFPISVFYPAGQNAYDLATADLNHDGKLDVVSCDPNL